MIEIWFNNGTKKLFLNELGYFDDLDMFNVRDIDSGKRIFIPKIAIQMWSRDE